MPEWLQRLLQLSISTKALLKAARDAYIAQQQRKRSIQLKSARAVVLKEQFEYLFCDTKGYI